MNKNLSFSVSAQRIELTDAAMLVAGTVNIYTAHFSFDSAWDGYQRTAVFSCGAVEREQLLTDDTCTVPWEVLSANCYLRVGVYGTKDGSRLPTIWTERRMYINPGAGPTQEAADPSPTLVEQLLGRMGDLSALKTQDKSSLVAAINEIFASVGVGGVSVTDAAINEDRHLIITLSTGKTIDAGYAVGPAGAPGKDGLGVPAPTAEDAGKVPVVLEDASYGLGRMIPVPETAEVGQTIVVKAVDADGKSTEWEAVDMASGESNWTELYKKTFEHDEDIYPQIEITGFQSSYNEFEVEMQLNAVTNTGNAVSIYINGAEKWISNASKQLGKFSVLFKIRIVGKYALIVGMNVYGESVKSSSISGSNYAGSGYAYLPDGIISSIGYKSYGFKTQAGSIIIVRAK